MPRIYKIFSALLSYPTAELQESTSQLFQVLDSEKAISEAERGALRNLLSKIGQDDLIDLQSRYVELFDRTRSLSLHLFEHVHGESRDRGQAMVSLLERYRRAGLDVTAKELPDFIPMFLEFLSTLPEEEARVDLGEAAHIFAALAERLRKRQSGYDAIFESLVVLSEALPDMSAAEQLRETKIEDPSDLVQLDRAWEEAEVRFGPHDAADQECPRARAIVRAMAADQKAKGARP